MKCAHCKKEILDNLFEDIAGAPFCKDCIDALMDKLSACFSYPEDALNKFDDFPYDGKLYN